MPFLVVLLAGLFLQPRSAHAGVRQAQDELAELGRALRSDRPEARRSAVRALARDGTRDAWLLVMEALGDPASAVGDAAQLALARIADERVLADLLGRTGLRSKEAVVRARAAEAVGRVTLEVDAVELAKALGGEPNSVKSFSLVFIQSL
jgi:HEAT repeat protein